MALAPPSTGAARGRLATAVQEHDGPVRDGLDDPDVREPVVRAAVPVAIVGVVEEDQIAGRRPLAAAPEHDPVPRRRPVQRRHAAPLARRGERGEPPERQPLRRVHRLHEARAVGVEAGLADEKRPSWPTQRAARAARRACCPAASPRRPAPPGPAQAARATSASVIGRASATGPLSGRRPACQRRASARRSPFDIRLARRYLTG